MDESFEQRPLLERDTLRALQQRQDMPSLVRLILHLIKEGASVRSLGDGNAPSQY